MNYHLKRFKRCKDINPLPFDFYLPELNICIEYHGVQHYKPIAIFGGEIEFKKRVKRDKIKLNFCQDNNINLIIIKYDENIINKLTLIT